MDVSARLTGRVAFITGAARGQGRAHALRLASEGADILALDLAGPLPGVPYESATPDDLAETARQVEARDRRILTHQGDVRDFEDMQAFVERGVAELGRLDIVVANAAICIAGTWDEFTPTMFKDTMDINITGVWNTVMACVPHVIAGGNGGAVVLTSSGAGKKMQPFALPYTTSKHALVGMTRAFAAELGKHDIRVNSVHPGAVATPMAGDELMAAMERASASNPKLAAMGTPFLNEGWMEADDIANAVAFLVSDEARFITAEHLSVDAGVQHF